MIIHPEIAISELSSEQLMAIFTGKITNWKQVGGPNRPVLVWTYPDGNPIRRIYNTVLNNPPVTTQAMVAPDPEAMLEGVGDQPGSIGYIPGAWLTPDVKIVSLDAKLRLALLQPVLVLSDETPQGEVRRLIGCLQTGSGQQILKKHYQP